jgi:hypothetical protein
VHTVLVLVLVLVPDEVNAQFFSSSSSSSGSSSDVVLLGLENPNFCFEFLVVEVVVEIDHG